MPAIEKSWLSSEDNSLAQKYEPPPGIPQETHIVRQSDKRKFKQIVFGQTGYVMPGEVVAILGPSGSGKTSLLNVLSQRTFLAQDSYSEGTVKINGTPLHPGDYSQLGAYVQ